MPYCPHCRIELEPAKIVCPRCGTSPVDELAPLPEADPDIELVRVYRAQGEVEAQMIRGLLESDGIESMLHGEAVRLTHGLTLDGLAVVDIVVRREDSERASAIIAAMSDE